MKSYQTFIIQCSSLNFAIKILLESKTLFKFRRRYYDIIVIREKVLLTRRASPAFTLNFKHEIRKNIVTLRTRSKNAGVSV